MKHKLFICLVFAIFTLFSCNYNQIQTAPLEELKEIGLNMNQINPIEYSYYIKSFQSYNGDTTVREGTMYFEHNSMDTSIGFNFYHKSVNTESFFNGDYVITMLTSDSAALKKPLCDFNNGHMTVYPYLELSFGAIQNFLMDSLFSFQTDSLIKSDTVIGNEKCSSYSFWADNILVDTHKKMTKGRKWINLVIRKKDNLPLKYSQKTKSHYNEVLFTNYSIDKEYSPDKFLIENVPDYYKWDKLKKYMTVLSDEKAPDWELPLLDGNLISLSSLKGKFVLLDFWFIGCGACVESIPVLNELQAKYNQENFEIIGVNCFSNNVEKIKEYCSTQGMNYKNIWNGEKICDDYKINAAPIFYLVNPEGEIVYSQIGHDEKKLKKNIDELINKTPIIRGLVTFTPNQYQLSNVQPQPLVHPMSYRLLHRVLAVQNWCLS